MALTIYFDDVDVTSDVRLDSLRLAMQAIKGQVGAGTLTIDDPTGTAGPAPAAKEWRVEESESNPTVIAGGFIAERDVDRGPLRAGVQRQFNPVLEDWNTVLTDRVFKGSAGNRPKETDVQRVLWMLGTGTMSMLDGTGRGHVPGENTVEMDKADYRGKTPLDLLDECAEAAGKNFYIYYKNGTGWSLYYDVVAATENQFTSTLKISDDPDDVDSSTVFGASRITYRKDPERVRSGILVEYDGGWAYARDTSTKAQYRALQRTAVKKNIKTRAKAEAWAEKQLERFDSETTSIALTVSVPPSAMGQLVAGKRIKIKMRHLGHTAYTYFRITGILISRRWGRRGVSDVMYDVRLTLKDKVRPLNKGSDKPEKAGQTPEGETANTGPYPITTFPDTVAPATLSNGSNIHFDYAADLFQGRYHGETVTSLIPPTWKVNTNWNGRYVKSTTQGYNGWTSAPSWSDCPGIVDSVQSGFIENEVWLSATMPAIPSNAAGIAVDLGINSSGGSQGPGQGEVLPVEAVALGPEQPDVLRLGTVVGSAMRDSTLSAFIPLNVLPPAGSNLYLGLRTSWRHTGVDDPYVWVCGFTWAFMSNSWQTDNDGVEYCGRAGRVSVLGAFGGYDGTWRIWDAGAPTLGITAETAAAPWAGSNTLYDAGTIGAGDSWGMGSNTFYVEDDAPAGKGFYIVGGEEDEGQADGPWSGGNWGHEYAFTIDAHGSTTDAGTRAIESTTTSGGLDITGTVHLGDATRAEGVSVSAGGTEVYVAKTLTTGEIWKAKFDTRSGLYVRGKLWKASDGEPAQWDVQTAIAPTDDPLDRWTLWVKAGNDGTSQRVEVSNVVGFASGSNGQRIVKEWLGYASGSHVTLNTAHQFREGTLLVYINGHAVAPSTVDPENSTFTIDYIPTADCIIRATYVVA